jgi:hypothetical protein
MDDVKVEELRDEDGKPLFRVITPKFKEPFEVYKMGNGYAMYGIRSTAANTSSKLDGAFTRSKDAMAYLLAFITSAQPSVSVQRDEKYKRNHPDKAQEAVA